MTEPMFDRAAVRAFRFLRCRFDADSGEAQLVYAFDAQGGASAAGGRMPGAADAGPEMVESIRFPGAPFALDDARAAAVERALRLLHLIAGVSYYKAAVPPEIVIDGYAIDADTAALLTLVYENGLGEFAYRNGMSLRGKIRFPVGLPSPACGRGAGGEGERAGMQAPLPQAGEGVGRGPAQADAPRAARAPSPGPAGHPLPQAGEGIAGAPSLGLAHSALVAIGGGKDSLVSIEALRALGVAQTATWVGSSPLIRSCAERTGLALFNIERKLSPLLFELNKTGALNGHIPVTAVNSAILVLAAVLRGDDQVVFSNEHSASYGSQIPGTGEVNHQWSKGWVFEQNFAAHVKRHIAADLHYYSLLRPWSELAVARQFARLDHYDAHFSSCNRNFHLLGEKPAQRWCGVCPKCHFVFLALAPFMPKPRLMGIFGRNLLDEPQLAGDFDALLEYGNHKPFECVGEGRESRAAMALLAASPAWREDALVERFAREILPQLDADAFALDPLLQPQSGHGLPSKVAEGLYAHFRA